VLDILFILHAEHEMNCSTAAARHLASRYLSLVGILVTLIGDILIRKCLLVAVLMSTLLLLELWERFMVHFMVVQTRYAIYSHVFICYIF